MKVSIENVLTNRTYPDTGHTIAVVDTGYAGFLGVPAEVFERLGFRDLELEKKTMLFADGKRLEAEGSYGRLGIEQADTKLDGFVETWAGLDEVLLGTDALRHFRLDLDNCLRMISIHKCGSSR